jgi:hypothetical protein
MDGDLDERGIEAFIQMDAEGDFYLPEGEVIIDDETLKSLREWYED